MPNTAEASQLLSPDLLARLERLELVSRKVFRGRMKGERRSRRKGQSVEFADFRNYVPGDDLRLIDCEFPVSAEISASPAVMDTYDKTLTAFRDGLKRYVVARGGVYLPVVTSTPFDKLVLDVLCRQGVLR